MHAVVLDMEAVSQTDTDGADVLSLWDRAGAIDVIGTDHVFSAVYEAVDALGPHEAGRLPAGRTTQR